LNKREVEYYLIILAAFDWAAAYLRRQDNERYSKAMAKHYRTLLVGVHQLASAAPEMRKACMDVATVCPLKDNKDTYEISRDIVKGIHDALYSASDWLEDSPPETQP
jgi:hypothetical protein